MADIKLEMGYADTNFKRQYVISSATTNKEEIRAGVKAINASLAAGTDNGLSEMFRADDFDAAESIGAFNHINSVTIVEKTVTKLEVE